MKAIINNFGPIDRFEYDFSKNIIVTYGDNNIGKSYSMQIVYLFLKYLYEAFNRPFLYHGFVGGDVFFYSRYNDTRNSTLEEKIDSFAKKHCNEEDITDFVRSEIEAIFSNVFLMNFINGCKNTFGNYENLCTKKPSITVEFSEITIRIDLESSSLVCDFSMPKIEFKKSVTYYHKARRTDSKHTIYYSEAAKIEQVANTLAQEIMEKWTTIVRSIGAESGPVYFLPASRSGIYNGMSAFSSIIVELSKNRATLTKKIELPGVAEPTADYFLKLSNVKSRENIGYKPYYKEIEDEILKGSVGINRKKNVITYKSGENGEQYEMTEVSSMVSEISPIVAFFKYIISDQRNFRFPAQQGIIFIEEPEAHLHPENQIKLAKVFSQMPKTGIKLVMSSHSNYIFNKFNNLVLEKKILHTDYEPILLKRGEKGSVSKYIEIDELGAVDENFTDVSQQLLDEREMIIANYEFD